MQKRKQNLSKTEQNVKMIFFGILRHLESENLKQMKVRQNTDASSQKHSAIDHVL